MQMVIIKHDLEFFQSLVNYERYQLRSWDQIWCSGGPMKRHFCDLI